MCETGGDINLFMVCCRQCFADPLSERGRADAYINGDIEGLAGEHLQEFALSGADTESADPAGRFSMKRKHYPERTEVSGPPAHSFFG